METRDVLWSLGTAVITLLLGWGLRWRKTRAEIRALVIDTELKLDDFKNRKIKELETVTREQEDNMRLQMKRYQTNTDLFVQHIREIETSNAKLIKTLKEEQEKRQDCVASLELLKKQIDEQTKK